MIMKSQFFGFTDSGVRFTFLFSMSSIQLKLTGNQMASSVTGLQPDNSTYPEVDGELIKFLFNQIF